MALYLYRMSLYKTGQPNVYGLPDTSVDTTDFETNDKSLATKVDSVVVSETAFIIDKSYTEFEALLVAPISWTDVKYVENNTTYTIYLLVEGG